MKLKSAFVFLTSTSVGWVFDFIYLFVIVSLIFPKAGLAKEKKLSSHALALKNSISLIKTDRGSEFATVFPKDKKEFVELCDSPSFDQLYDCDQVINVGVKKVLRKSPLILGPKIANLASEVEFGADAPNYLQSAWAEFCQNSPKEFVTSILQLEPAKQKLALLFLTKGIEKDTNAKLDACIKSLVAAKFDTVAKLAKTVRLKNPIDQH